MMIDTGQHARVYLPSCCDAEGNGRAGRNERRTCRYSIRRMVGMALASDIGCLSSVAETSRHRVVVAGRGHTQGTVHDSVPYTGLDTVYSTVRRCTPASRHQHGNVASRFM